MFDHTDSVVGVSELGVLSGESHEARDADQAAYELTCRELADGWVASDRDVLPDDLEDLAPGVFLAAVVASVDPSRLNGHDAVRLMQARARLSSHHEAGKYAAMAEVAFSPVSDRRSGVVRSSDQVEYAAVEVAAGLSLTRRASEDQLSRAVSLSGRLSRVGAAFSQGHLDLARVQVFDQLLGHLPDTTVNTVLDRVLPEAAELTTGQLRARLAKLVLEADPDGENASYRAGLEGRKVATYSNPDHTANFNISSAAPDDVAAARAHVEELARRLKTKDEPRTLDQLRSDVAMDLLKGGHCGIGDTTTGGAGGGRVNVTVPAATLAELSDTPGEFNGYGPVIAEIARKTVAENVDGEWTFCVTDQGRPVATGTLSRRPTASQCRQIQATYPQCVMVGCRQPAYHCDLDHRRPGAQGGPTHNDNLAPLCRHHHMVRHHTRWKLRRLPDGDHQWTSPLGHTYTRKRDPPD